MEDLLPNISVGLVGRIKVFEEQNDQETPGMPTGEELLKSTYAMPGIDLNVGIFENTVKAHLFASGMESKRGSIFDGQADISLSLSPRVDILGGYRFFFIDIEEEKYSLQKSDSGPFMGFSLSF